VPGNDGSRSRPNAAPYIDDAATYPRHRSDAFTLSYDAYARTTLTAGNRNTLPLEIYAPKLFAIGTATTALSLLLIGTARWTIAR